MNSVSAQQPSSQLRYVVLHHTGIPQPHYDLMVETATGSALATWRCSRWPPVAGQTFTRIGDHRRDYLDYEGPVSGNRGRVQRVANGLCQLAPRGEQLCLRVEDGSEYPLLAPRGASTSRGA